MFMSIFYKGKTGPYIYYIAKIAYLLNIEHEIEVHDTKSNKEVWQQILDVKWCDVIRKQKEFDEYIEDQVRYNTKYIQETKLN